MRYHGKVISVMCALASLGLRRALQHGTSQGRGDNSRTQVDSGGRAIKLYEFCSVDAVPDCAAREA
jgi:hypothetical protein